MIGVFALTWLALERPLAALFVGICASAACLFRRLGVWRSSVTLSFCVAIARGYVDFPEAIGYVLQFGPIAVAGLALSLSSKQVSMRVSDRWLVGASIGIVLLALIGTLTSLDPMVTLTQTVVLGVMMFFLTVTYRKRWHTKPVIVGDLSLLYVLVLAVLALGLLAGYFGLPNAIGEFGRLQGLLSNANYTGFLAAVLIPMSFFIFRAADRKVLSVVGILVGLASLIQSGSRGGFLAAAVAMLVLLTMPVVIRFLLPLLPAAIGVMGLVFMLNPHVVDNLTGFFSREQQASDFSSGRGSIYESLIEQWQAKPILGTGYRTTETFTLDGVSGHNVYLSVLTELGILGALLFLILVLTVMKGAAAIKRQPEGVLVGAALAVAVMEVTESSVFGWGGPTALLSWLIVFGCSALGRVSDQKSSEAYSAAGDENAVPKSASSHQRATLNVN